MTGGANGLLFWAMAYKMSELLFAADEAGLFAGLAGKEERERLAARTGWHPKALDSVLEAFARAGIVSLDEQHPRLASGAEKALPLVWAERKLAAWHRDNASLERALAGAGGGDPLDAAQPPGFLETFADAMGQAARETALMVRRLARPSDDAHVVDLGGADGAVAMALAEALPEATFSVVDRDALRGAFDRRLAASTGVARRVRFSSHDLRRPETLAALVAEADLILVLNVLHLLSGEIIDALLAAIHRDARPGCRLVVREILADGGGELAPLFLVDWLCCGSCFRDDTKALAARLARAGFRPIRDQALPGALDRFLVVEAP